MFKTIQTIELSGSALDWAVAKCEGWDGFDIHSNGAFELERSDTGDCLWLKCFEPSTDWAQGGPIIERIKGFLFKHWLEYSRDCQCQAEIHNYDGDCIAFGPTPLIAAMRCYVASKLGDTVEVPSELLEAVWS
jgi:hypothetical protein